MKVLVMEKNLIMLSRIKNSLSGHEVSSNAEYSGEDVVFINVEAFPVDKIRELKAKGAKVIAYCSHKNVELQLEARSAGADLVVPNSQVVDAGRILDGLKP
ncbi:hypothetical protein [Hydrogenobacter hydrogenophilus]|uniref:Response regulatory domain-containing protein n=1 Tax=Hydrogenobacter hydrogenophilus TaxID=35835 RepID=A0A285P137_9AQUI|nr:hypothetical protein [Hydrogenobacter hydrogenophilus]SNZ15168.1 hypothetical protein SAMN06265353_1309 [Hydrogenobacter hydrogenophilus]